MVTLYINVVIRFPIYLYVICSVTMLQFERRNRSNMRECALLLRNTAVMTLLMQMVP